MYTQSIIITAVFSLAWFVAGVVAGSLAGRRLFQGASKAGRTSRAKAEGKQTGGVEVYVGNLAYETSEKELKQLFEKHGAVRSVRIIKNRLNGKSKGYGFVKMDDRDEARNAIKAVHGFNLKGRKVVANEAKSRPRDDE